MWYTKSEASSCAILLITTVENFEAPRSQTLDPRLGCPKTNIYILVNAVDRRYMYDRVER